MITLTINGKKIEANEGSAVLDAALAKGIDVPRLCHHAGVTAVRRLPSLSG
jgi:NADH dehydrogenase/NADH:ubiquinone oxidoreductase subunit G